MVIDLCWLFAACAPPRVATSSGWWWAVPLTSLIAAGIGAGAAFSGLVWRYRAEYKLAIVSDLFEIVQEAADVATEYWLLDPSKGGTDDVQQSRNLKARLIGYSERIEAGIDAARPHLKRIDTLGMEPLWARLLDGLSGGDFGNDERESDPERAEAVQVAAANLIRELRLATDRRFLGRDHAGR